MRVYGTLIITVYSDTSLSVEKECPNCTNREEDYEQETMPTVFLCSECGHNFLTGRVEDHAV